MNAPRNVQKVILAEEILVKEIVPSIKFTSLLFLEIVSKSGPDKNSILVALN